MLDSILPYPKTNVAIIWKAFHNHWDLRGPRFHITKPNYHGESSLVFFLLMGAIIVKIFKDGKASYKVKDEIIIDMLPS